MEGGKPRSGIRRVVTAAFGVFFVLLAVAIVQSAEGPIDFKVAVAALVIALVGVDACVSAVRDRRSWIERIGPLP